MLRTRTDGIAGGTGVAVPVGRRVGRVDVAEGAAAVGVSVDDDVVGAAVAELGVMLVVGIG
jgi:hypothetical protein